MVKDTSQNLSIIKCGLKVQNSMLPQFPNFHTVGPVQTKERQEGGGGKAKGEGWKRKGLLIAVSQFIKK